MSAGNTTPSLPLDTGKLRELLAKATPGEWSHDGEDSEAGFHVEAIYAPDGKRLFDAHNSTALSLVEDKGGDERGDWHDVWDETSRNNAALIVAMHAALPLLLDKAEQAGRAEAELAEFKRLGWNIATQVDLEAAEAQLTTLTSEREKLREALKPFADYAEGGDRLRIPDDYQVTKGSPLALRQLTMGDLRRARSTLSQGGGNVG